MAPPALPSGSDQVTAASAAPLTEAVKACAAPGAMVATPGEMETATDEPAAGPWLLQAAPSRIAKIRILRAICASGEDARSGYARENFRCRRWSWCMTGLPYPNGGGHKPIPPRSARKTHLVCRDPTGDHGASERSGGLNSRCVELPESSGASTTATAPR